MKRLITGIQPSGNITLGNYLGAIKSLINLQNEEDIEMLVFIADLHSITVPQEKQQLKKNIKNLAAIYLASGLNLDKAKIFIQSEVPCHNQLGWVMECNSYIGELERMTQFKDKKQKQTTGVTAGLLTYPPLMAADILLYDADIVPVGEDQKQHLEITRNLAERFNNKYGETFKVPEPYITKVGAKIMSLTDPTKKMSKSDPNPKSYILLLDDINVAKKKIKSAVTDSETKIYYDVEKKPGISNLLTIYSALTDRTIDDIVEQYKDKSYAELKNDLAEVVGDFLIKIQENYNYYIQSSILENALNNGRDIAYHLASRKIQKVYRKIGLGRY